MNYHQNKIVFITKEPAYKAKTMAEYARALLALPMNYKLSALDDCSVVQYSEKFIMCNGRDTPIVYDGKDWVELVI